MHGKRLRVDRNGSKALGLLYVTSSLEKGTQKADKRDFRVCDSVTTMGEIEILLTSCMKVYISRMLTRSSFRTAFLSFIKSCCDVPKLNCDNQGAHDRRRQTTLERHDRD